MRQLDLRAQVVITAQAGSVKVIGSFLFPLKAPNGEGTGNREQGTGNREQEIIQAPTLLWKKETESVS
ncbi:MAG: hypothetical protein AB4426_20645 [Xenococcaceae cyanobacterium]